MFRHYFGVGVEEYRAWEWRRFQLHKDYVRSLMNRDQTVGGVREQQ